MPQADMEGFTELAMGTNQPQQANQHGLYAQFYMHPQNNAQKSKEEGRPIFQDKPYVMIMVPGDKSTIVRRPVRTGQAPMHDNNRFHNEYVAFIQNEKQPLEGTPLEEWSQVSAAQAMELKYFNIRTVEQLASIADSNAQKMMGLRLLRDKAQKYIEITKADAPLVMLQAEIEKRDNEAATMLAAMAEMKAELAELKGAPKRGRPKKED